MIRSELNIESKYIDFTKSLIIKFRNIAAYLKNGKKKCIIKYQYRKK